MWDALVSGLVGPLSSSEGQRATLLARARRLVAKDQTVVALRLVEGAQPGLRGRWRRGHATLSPGRLEFVSYVGGRRAFPRAPITIEITAAAMAKRRKPRTLELLHPTYDIVLARTPTGVVELGVPAPFRLEWVLSRLAG